MTAVLFAPHGDDETLWSSFLCQRHRPLVVVVLDCGAERRRETEVAVAVLGCPLEQWPFPEDAPDWKAIGRRVAGLAAAYERCFAPAYEPGGHEHHNAVAQHAEAYFGDRVTSYLTYVRGHGRSTSGELVTPEPEWVLRKLRALACYESQIREPSTRPWFMGPMDEYVA